MPLLDKNIQRAKGIGAARAKDFARLGIVSLRDALLDFPFRYDDLSKKTEISSVSAGERITIQGAIATIENRRAKNNPRMTITQAMVEDGTGSIKAVWFHQGFLTKTLKPGVIVSLSGKVDDRYGLSLVNPIYEVLGKQQSVKQTGRILPVYKLTGAITQKMRRALAEEATKGIEEVEEWMPQDIIKSEEFMPLHDAIKEMHFPSSTEKQERALDRLKFDEFFLHQILHRRVRRALQKQKSSKIPFNKPAVTKAVKALPFELTDAQKRSSWSIIQDLEKETPMNRLLEGDVGTGKTVVAALAAVNAASSTWQTAFLAPTEILADQHAKGLQKIFGDMLTIGLFTRTKRRIKGKQVTKKQMLDALKDGKIDLAIGTHALLSEGVLFNRLGLMIVDEQHRFGVKQRRALKDRQGDEDGIPHLLSMTATPIPRSLALVLYGDLDRSLLDEYPAGRKKIETFLVEQGQEPQAHKRIKEEMDAGRQVFVVCPLIEESDALGVKSVTETYTIFKKGPFKKYKLGILHGKLKTMEKDEIMEKFSSGELDMVISTTVVEVGVDIPNATVMFIEGAERFGLAQLHQLRGRVGRGDHQSYCYLHPSGRLSELARKRLIAVVGCQNGFQLADKDLELRGPGNIFGTEQSGFEAFKLGTYADRELLYKAKDHAEWILTDDPTLKKWPSLSERVEEYIEEVHFE